MARTKAKTSEKPAARKKTTKPAAKKVTRKKRVDTSDLDTLIQERAYDHFQRRGAGHGDDWSDWLKAEKEVKKSYSGKKK